VQNHIRETDIFLVEVAVKAGNVIRILVDRPDDISIDQCVEISRYLNGQFDREVEDFSLEVSSPGLNAPFKVRQQYEKNVGRKVEVLATDGTKYEGKLEGLTDDGFTVKVKGRDKAFRFDEVKKTKAIISFN